MMKREEERIRMEVERQFRENELKRKEEEERERERIVQMERMKWEEEVRSFVFNSKHISFLAPSLPLPLPLSLSLFLLFFSSLPIIPYHL